MEILNQENNGFEFEVIYMSELKTICFLTTDLEGGGAQRVMCNLANYISNQGYNVRIVCFSNRQQIPLFSLNSSVSLYVLPKNFKHKDKLVPSCVELLVNLFKVIEPDVVIPFLMPITAYTYFAAREYGIKIIVSERNDPNKKEDVYWANLRKEIFYNADGKVYQTEDAKKYYDIKPRTKSKIIVNPLCIEKDYPFISSSKRENRIVCLGKYEPQKNLPLLISCFEDFLQYHSDYQLEIYGNDFHGLKASLHDLVINRGLEGKVQLFDAKPQIHDFIWNSKISILTSDYEGMPNALLETIALGIPSIATDCPCGGVRYIIKHEHNGLLAEVGNKQDIVQKMRRIAESSEFADSIARNGLELKTRFNIDFIGKEWLKFISCVTGLRLRSE